MNKYTAALRSMLVLLLLSTSVLASSQDNATKQRPLTRAQRFRHWIKKHPLPAVLAIVSTAAAAGTGTFFVAKSILGTPSSNKSASAPTDIANRPAEKHHQVSPDAGAGDACNILSQADTTNKEKDIDNQQEAAAKEAEQLALLAQQEKERLAREAADKKAAGAVAAPPSPAAVSPAPVAVPQAGHQPAPGPAAAAPTLSAEQLAQVLFQEADSKITGAGNHAVINKVQPDLKRYFDAIPLGQEASGTKVLAIHILDKLLAKYPPNTKITDQSIASKWNAIIWQIKRVLLGAAVDKKYDTWIDRIFNEVCPREGSTPKLLQAQQTKRYRDLWTDLCKVTRECNPRTPENAKLRYVERTAQEQRKQREIADKYPDMNGMTTNDFVTKILTYLNETYYKNQQPLPDNISHIWNHLCATFPNHKSGNIDRIVGRGKRRSNGDWDPGYPLVAEAIKNLGVSRAVSQPSRPRGPSAAAAVVPLVAPVAAPLVAPAVVAVHHPPAQPAHSASRTISQSESTRVLQQLSSRPRAQSQVAYLIQSFNSKQLQAMLSKMQVTATNPDLNLKRKKEALLAFMFGDTLGLSLERRSMVKVDSQGAFTYTAFVTDGKPARGQTPTCPALPAIKGYPQLKGFRFNPQTDSLKVLVDKMDNANCPYWVINQSGQAYANFSDDTGSTLAVLSGFMTATPSSTLDQVMQNVYQSMHDHQDLFVTPKAQRTRSNPQWRRGDGGRIPVAMDTMSQVGSWGAAMGDSPGREGGCGGAMRSLAPAFAAPDSDTAALWGALQGAMTHSDDISIATCAAESVLAWALLHGYNFDDAFELSKKAALNSLDPLQSTVGRQIESLMNSAYQAAIRDANSRNSYDTFYQSHSPFLKPRDPYSQQPPEYLPHDATIAPTHLSVAIYTIRRALTERLTVRQATNKVICSQLWTMDRDSAGATVGGLGSLAGLSFDLDPINDLAYAEGTQIINSFMQYGSLPQSNPRFPTASTPSGGGGGGGGGGRIPAYPSTSTSTQLFNVLMMIKNKETATQQQIDAISNIIKGQSADQIVSELCQWVKAHGNSVHFNQWQALTKALGESGSRMIALRRKYDKP